jgi:osmoprotectant transport system ATP-binding protein
VITFDAVTLARGGRPVLAGVSLSIARGEVVALVGRSGSGKTTLLRLVNRMLAPAGGRVSVDGRDAAAWDVVALRRHTGYVVQETGLFPHMTVAGNIGVVPRLLGWPRDRIAARVDELLALVGLPAAFASRWPDELSGGQRQRVGLARALAADPPVLLMDEPFGAVDPITRVDLHREFRRLHAATPRTVLIVTHDLREAWALADRIAVIAAGTLVACAAPDALANDPHPEVRALLATREDTRA